MTTTYIFGPMRKIPYFNFPAFDFAEAYLKTFGYKVLNPAQADREHGFDAMALPFDYDWSQIPSDFDFEATVRRNIDAIFQSDVLYGLKGWVTSAGARHEFALGVMLGKLVMFE